MSFSEPPDKPRQSTTQEWQALSKKEYNAALAHQRGSLPAGPQASPAESGIMTRMDH